MILNIRLKKCCTLQSSVLPLKMAYFLNIALKRWCKKNAIVWTTFPSLKMAKFFNIAPSSQMQKAFYLGKTAMFINIAPTICVSYMKWQTKFNFLLENRQFSPNRPPPIFLLDDKGRARNAEICSITRFLMGCLRKRARATRKMFQIWNRFSQFCLRIALKMCVGKLQNPGHPRSVCR